MAAGRPFQLDEEAPDSRTQVLAIRGEADMSTALEFNERLFRGAEAGKVAFVADLTEVSWIDSTMLNALLVGQRRTLLQDGRFAVVCRGRRVARVLELTGLDVLLDVFESRDAALAHVARTA